MNRWVNIEDGAPPEGKQVMVDWTDGMTGNKYLGYATFDKELGWKLNSSNHGNRPCFCYCDNFVSFWELKWNFDDGDDWDGVPYIRHRKDGEA